MVFSLSRRVRKITAGMRWSKTIRRVGRCIRCWKHTERPRPRVKRPLRLGRARRCEPSLMPLKGSATSFAETLVEQMRRAAPPCVPSSVPSSQRRLHRYYPRSYTCIALKCQTKLCKAGGIRMGQSCGQRRCQYRGQHPFPLFPKAETTRNTKRTPETRHGSTRPRMGDWLACPSVDMREESPLRMGDSHRCPRRDTGGSPF